MELAGGGVDAQGIAIPAVDLRSFTLPVLLATSDEASAHEVVLGEIDKASGGRTLWRAVELAVGSMA
jgi:DNA polymerase-3 subunit epsilon